MASHPSLPLSSLLRTLLGFYQGSEWQSDHPAWGLRIHRNRIQTHLPCASCGALTTYPLSLPSAFPCAIYTNQPRGPNQLLSIPSCLLSWTPSPGHANIDIMFHFGMSCAECYSFGSHHMLLFMKQHARGR